jgi:quercetin dioxygenase-like cupin family protein
MRHFIATGLAALFVAPASQAQSGPEDPLSNVTPQFAQAIPNIPGKSLKTVLVTYAPGGNSPSHTHARSAFILAYVLEGEIVSALNGQPPRTYKAGEW